MASGSAAEDRWRRGRQCHDADLNGEPEEGEVVVDDGAGCHSDTDTDEYYNRRHCSSESDETISDCETSSIVAPRWGATGKRGCSAPAARAGAVSPTPSAGEPEKSLDVVDADAEPMVAIPLAFAPPNLPSSVLMASASANLSGQSSSSQPANDDAMVTAAAAAANPPAEAFVHRERIAPPPPPAAGEQLRPHLVHQPPRAAPAAAGRQDPNGYTCKKCGMWFRNHQGLGGHMVWHKNRDLAAAVMLPAAEGAGAVAAGGRIPKPERPHVCDQCGAEFRYGVQLGGHKRKHWDGPRIVPKKKPRGGGQPVPPPPAEAMANADLTLALPVVSADDAPAVEAARPAVETRQVVLLFGIDIGPGAKPPTAQQGSPATESSESSTGGGQ